MILRKIFQDALIIAIIKSKWIFRNFLSLMTLLDIPIFVSLINIFFLRIVNITYNFSMVVLFMTSISAVAFTSQEIASDERSKTLAIFITLPIHPFSYALGTALYNLIYNSSNLLILTPFFFLLSLLTEKASIIVFILILIASLVGWLTCLSIGFLIGIYGMRKRWVYPLSSILSMMFAFVNPLFIPLKDLPVFVQYVFYLIPTTPVALSIKGIITGSPLDSILVNLILSFIYATFVFSLAIKRMEWSLD